MYFSQTSSMPDLFSVFKQVFWPGSGKDIDNDYFYHDSNFTFEGVFFLNLLFIFCVEVWILISVF